MAWLKGTQRSMETKSKMSKLNEKQRAQAVKLYVGGLSTIQVSKELGCGDELIRKIIKEAGVTRSRSEAMKLRLSDPETRKNWRESHTGMIREPHSEETKAKISNARKTEWQDKKYREHQIAVRKGKASRPGTPHSEESKLLISEQAKERYRNPEFAAKQLEIQAEVHSRPEWKKRQAEARRILWLNPIYKQKALLALTGKMETSLEKIVRLCLEKLQVEFEAQKIIGRAIADFFVEPNLIIEADGKYWHDKPEVAARDKKRDSWLRSKGYIILRISEEVIVDDPVPVLKEFLK